MKSRPAILKLRMSNAFHSAGIAPNKITPAIWAKPVSGWSLIKRSK